MEFVENYGLKRRSAIYLGRYCLTLLGVVCSFAYLERTIKNYLVYCKKGNFGLCSHMPQSRFDVCKKIRMVYKSKHETQNDFVASKEKSIQRHMGIANLKIVRKFSYGYSRIY